MSTWITPPKLHIRSEFASTAGMPSTITVGAPGTHGADVFGMQGIGVKTPIAAAVAAATVGFAMLIHIPKGATFSMGTLSRMLATGFPASSLWVGSTFSDDGAMPKLHFINAPPHTTSGIDSLLSWNEQP
jgi:hypothetical protein